jgi:molybdopterin-guanine dinucleotide biosynthesis protein A
MDQFPRCGPLAGIERALATGASPLLLVLAVDLPRLTADFLRELAAKASQGYGIIPRIAGQVEPLAAFYPRTAHSLAVEHLQTGKLAAREFAAASVAAKLAVFADFPAATTELFQNCNVPADLPMTCNPV